MWTHVSVILCIYVIFSLAGGTPRAIVAVEQPFGDPRAGLWEPAVDGSVWVWRTASAARTMQSLQIGTFEEESSQIQSLSTRPKPPNTVEPSFRITFNCDNNFISEIRCERAETAFVRAAGRISSVLALSVPVDVGASFESFCGRPNAKADPSCKSTNSVLGSASPAGFYEFTAEEAAEFDTDVNYLYPSSLAKQFFGVDSIPLSTDISASFNADFTWWIDEETDGDLAPAEYDLEEAIMHELLHGMGFISSWFAWLGASEQILTPSYGARNDAGQNMGFAKQYIFNKWIADNVNGVWMSTWADAISSEIARSVPPTSDWASWINTFRETAAYNLTKQLFHVAQSDAGMAFWYNDSMTGETKQAVLYTPQPYAGGSSVSHLDTMAYEAGPDWLMRPYAIIGARMEDIRPRSIEGSGSIGDVTINILRTLGYRTADQQVVESVERRSGSRKAPRGTISRPPKMR